MIDFAAACASLFVLFACSWLGLSPWLAGSLFSQVSTYAGDGTWSSFRDGPRLQATFGQPHGLCMDGNDILVAGEQIVALADCSLRLLNECIRARAQIRGTTASVASPRTGPCRLWPGAACRDGPTEPRASPNLIGRVNESSLQLAEPLHWRGFVDTPDALFIVSPGRTPSAWTIRASSLSPTREQFFARSCSGTHRFCGGSGTTTASAPFRKRAL